MQCIRQVVFGAATSKGRRKKIRNYLTSAKSLSDLFFFYLGFTAHQDYFTHFEPGVPEKKHMTFFLKQNLDCFPCDPSQAQTHNGEIIERLGFFIIKSLLTNIHMYLH